MIEAVVGGITEAVTGKAIDLLVGEDQFQEWPGKDQAKDAPYGSVPACRWVEVCLLAAAPALSWGAPPHASVVRMSAAPTIIVRDVGVPVCKAADSMRSARQHTGRPTHSATPLGTGTSTYSPKISGTP